MSHSANARDQVETPSVDRFYRLTGPFRSLIRRAFPNAIVTSEDIVKAMLAVARLVRDETILDTKKIIRLARS
jgi:hypothetical protein